MGSQKPEMDPKVGCFQSKKWEVHSGIWKTNMAMEHEPFEDVFPIEDIPARHVSLPLGTLGNLVLAPFCWKHSFMAGSEKWLHQSQAL